MIRLRGVEHLRGILDYHRGLLGDRKRNRAFYRALEKHVTPSSTVLDIGSGTGIWAVAAARLGARRVVAVESERLLIPVIHELARENGVQGKVHVVRGDSRRLALGERFDVVVSEMIGCQAFDEDIVAILADARERFLKPRGVLIPRSIALVAAPCALPTNRGLTPRGVPLRFDSFLALARNVPASTESVPLRVVSRPAELIRVDLATTRRRPALHGLTARWQLDRGRRVDCVAVWVRAVMTEGITLDTFPGTHWPPTAYPLEPIVAKGGILAVDLNLSLRRPHWKARVLGDGETVQAFSPLFAYGWAMARLGRGKRVPQRPRR